MARQVQRHPGVPAVAIGIQVVVAKGRNVGVDDGVDRGALRRVRRHHLTGPGHGARESRDRRERPVVEIIGVDLGHVGFEPPGGQQQQVRAGPDIRRLVGIGNVVPQLVVAQVDTKLALLRVVHVELACVDPQIGAAD